MRLLAPLLAALFVASCAHDAPEAPAISYGATIEPAALREDFEALYAGLQRAHYDLYAHTPKATLDRRFAEVLASLDQPLSLTDAQVRFQTFVAEGHVAHARIDFPGAAFGAYRETGGAIFPLSVRIEGERVFVTDNLSGLPDIAPGAEIVRLDGQPIATWLTRLRRHISADNLYLAHAILEPQFGAVLWLEQGPRDAYALTLNTDGRTQELTLPSRNRTDMRAAAAQAPAMLELDYTERVARVLPGGIAYLRPGVFMNLGADPYDTTEFHAFIDAAVTQFRAEGATHLLIDLRDNPGGDNSFSDRMISWFADEPFRFTSDFRVRVSPETVTSNAARLETASADSVSRRYAELFANASTGDVVHFAIDMAQPRGSGRFEGSVYALINRRSYSNTVSVAAIIQDYGFGQIIGEPTADLVTTYGAMETFTLPHTGLVVGYPKALIIRPNGDERVQGVTPDILIETPILQPADDPVLTEALRAIAAP